MRVLVTGGTGFIGQALIQALLERGDQVTLLCRNFKKAKKLFNDNVSLLASVKDSVLETDAVVNLAGEPIIGRRWTKKRKQKLKKSRIGLTEELVGWMEKCSTKPEVLISSSAIGFYGNYPEETSLTEIAKPRACFASELCREWEMAALQAEELGVRVCLLRTGIVLEKHGGALKRMWLPFKCGMGGRIGHGKQWFSWIHLQDMVDLILFLIDNQNIRGAVNATASHPVTNECFSKQLAHTLWRPALLPMPQALVKLLFGEASELLLEGQRVVPKKLLDNGYQFRYPHLSKALAAIVK